MRDGNRDKRRIIRIVISGLLVLGLCVGICFAHVLDIQLTFQNNKEDNLSIQYNTILDQFNEDVSEQMNLTKQLNNEFDAFSVDSELRVKEARNVLEEYTNFYPQYRFAFVDKQSYKVIFSDHTESALDILGKFSDERKEDKAIAFAQQDWLILDGEKQSSLVASYPIYDASNSVVGYAMTFREFANENLSERFKPLEDSCDCFLVNRMGLVLASNTTYLSDEETAEKDFFEYIVDGSDGSNTTDKKIRNVRNKLAINRQGSFDYKDFEGKEIKVVYSLIDGTENTYLFAIYHPDFVLNSVSPMLLRSLMSCMFIIVLLIGLIGFVWASSKKSQRTIEELAFGDKVTGGKNLNYFQQHAIEIISSNKESPFLLYRFDILNFRYINEAYGHIKADTVLATCVREFEKIFSSKEICVRINSDQFMALIINDATVSFRWQSYCSAVGDAARLEGVRYPIRFKTGIYQLRKGEYNIAVMMDHANVARKSLTGEEKILEATYSDTIITTMHKVDMIEAEMQSALANGEFKVFLQPKWNIIKNEVSGAEALVRWIKPDGTVVFPNEFIPVFEKNGFIEKLDFFMLESLCRMLKELNENPEEYNMYPISVNQSRLLINNPDYVKNVMKIISKYEAPIPYIELEITETIFFSERSKMIEIMNQLKDYGLTLAMDDFGSGYSSLNILKDIPFDVLKIDREFFSESVTSESSIWIMEKIIEMAEGLGITSICEGVEKEEQVEILKRIGCDYAQGYYYAKPMPMQDYIDRYCKKNKKDEL